MTNTPNPEGGDVRRLQASGSSIARAFWEISDSLFGHEEDSRYFPVLREIADRALEYDRHEAGRSCGVGEGWQTAKDVRDAGNNRTLPTGLGEVIAQIGFERAEEILSAWLDAPVCGTCNGRGEIGGFVSMDSGYQTDPCPDCRQPRGAGRRSNYTEQAAREAGGNAWEWPGDAMVYPLGLALDMAQEIDRLTRALSESAGGGWCEACKGSGEVIGIERAPSCDPQDEYEAPMSCPKCDGTGVKAGT